jgi:hypothetical protein
MARQMIATYGYEEDFVAAARDLKSAGFDTITNFRLQERLLVRLAASRWQPSQRCRLFSLLAADL